MSTIGRPLSLHSVRKTLGAIAADLPVGPDRAMCESLAEHLDESIAAPSLHRIVVDLDLFLGRQRDFLGEATASHLVKCIDSLAVRERRLVDEERMRKIIAKGKRLSAANEKVRETISAKATNVMTLDEMLDEEEAILKLNRANKALAQAEAAIPALTLSDQDILIKAAGILLATGCRDTSLLMAASLLIHEASRIND